MCPNLVVAKSLPAIDDWVTSVFPRALNFRSFGEIFAVFSRFFLICFEYLKTHRVGGSSPEAARYSCGAQDLLITPNFQRFEIQDVWLNLRCIFPFSPDLFAVF